MNLETYKKQINLNDWNEILENKMLCIVYLYYFLKQEDGADKVKIKSSDMIDFILNKINSIIDYDRLSYYKTHKNLKEPVVEELTNVLKNNFKNFEKLNLEAKLNTLQDLICIHFNSYIREHTSLNIAKYALEFIENYAKGIEDWNSSFSFDPIDLDYEEIENELRLHLKEMNVETNSINRSIKRLKLYYRHKDKFSEDFILSLSNSYIESLSKKPIKNNPKLQRELLTKIENKEIKKLSGLTKEISNYLERQIPIFNFKRFEKLKKTIDKYTDSLESYTTMDTPNSIYSIKFDNTPVENLDGNTKIQEDILIANKLLIELDEVISRIIKTQKMNKARASDVKKLAKILAEQEKNSQE